MTTVPGKTADEYGVLIQQLFASKRIDPSGIDGIIISTVVPPVLPTFITLCRDHFGKTPLVVDPGIKTGMPVLYDNPREVGADRIVNAVAAFKRVKGACIVVDFGTATTFDVISAKGEYIGGAIAPGIVISLEALFKRAAKLPRVEVIEPKQVIGKNTVGSMQSGVFYGYVGLVDGIVRQIQRELGSTPTVIATGGLAELIAPTSETIDDVDQGLTLTGLRLLYERNL